MWSGPKVQTSGGSIIGTKLKSENDRRKNLVDALLAPGGLAGSTDTAGLLDVYHTPEKYGNLIDQNAAGARVKELSGIDPSQGASDDEIRIGSQGMEEERRREALGQKQRSQIEAFGNEFSGQAADFRKTLAASLAGTASDRFNQLNPGILEDLNSRGLFTSQTARDKSQADALKSIALDDQNSLMGFDRDTFNQLNDIRGTALSAQLGGDQSALDALMDSRKAGLQRSFELADMVRQQQFAAQLASQQRRNALTSSLLGLAGQLGAGYLSGSFGGNGNGGGSGSSGGAGGYDGYYYG